MTGMEDDPLRERLRELPAIAPDDLSSARLRRRALAVLAEERALAARPWLRPVAHAWGRVVMPTLVGSAVALYLMWAVEFTNSLYR
jgi:hypothetical protein